MKDCNDKNYDKVVEVSAFPIKDCTFETPAYIPQRISMPILIFPKDSAHKIPIYKGSADLKEKASLTTSGGNMEITLSWKVEIGSDEDMQLLEFLRNTPCHFIVTTFPNNNLLIRSLEESYFFSYYISDGYYSCSLTVNNLSGIIPIKDIVYELTDGKLYECLSGIYCVKSFA